MAAYAHEALGTRLAAGDHAAVRDCYTMLGPRVLSYLRRLVPYDEAEDVMQRVFVDLWHSRDRYDPQRSFEAWVFGIARKRAIDHLRRRRWQTVPLEDAMLVSDADGRVDADAAVWADEVRRVLARLPKEQRVVLELAYFSGRTQREVAAELGLPLGTVKARTSRGLKRMGHHLGIVRATP